jgi:hypothetical protein
LLAIRSQQDVDSCFHQKSGLAAVQVGVVAQPNPSVKKRVVQAHGFYCPRAS